MYIDFSKHLSGQRSLEAFHFPREILNCVLIYQLLNMYYVKGTMPSVPSPTLQVDITISILQTKTPKLIRGEVAPGHTGYRRQDGTQVGLTSKGQGSRPLPTNDSTFFPEGGKNSSPWLSARLLPIAFPLIQTVGSSSPLRDTDWGLTPNPFPKNLP